MRSRSVLLPLALVALFAWPPSGASAQEASGGQASGAQAAEGRTGALVPLLDAIERARERYRGRIIEADVVAPRPDEFAEIVYEMRLLTEGGNVLQIRIDAASGAFIDVEGRGLVDARRAPASGG